MGFVSQPNLQIKGDRTYGEVQNIVWHSFPKSKYNQVQENFAQPNKNSFLPTQFHPYTRSTSLKEILLTTLDYENNILNN